VSENLRARAQARRGPIVQVWGSIPRALHHPRSDFSLPASPPKKISSGPRVGVGGGSPRGEKMVRAAQGARGR